MQPISRHAAGSAVLCSLFRLIPIAANGRTTVRLCSVVATKRCRKHSYHDREIPEQAESLLAEQKPGPDWGPPPTAPEENPWGLETGVSDRDRAHKFLVHRQFCCPIPEKIDHLIVTSSPLENTPEHGGGGIYREMRT